MRAKYIGENFNFKRGMDPMDSLNIGDVRGRARRKIENAMKPLVDEFGGKISIEELTGTPHMRGLWNPWIPPNLLTLSSENRNLYEYEIQFIEGRDYNQYIVTHVYLFPTGVWLANLGSYQNFRDAVNSLRDYFKRYDDRYTPSIKESISFERGKDPITALGVGIRSSIIKFLIDNGEFDPDNLDELKISDSQLLVYCCKYGKFDWAKFLIEQGADVNRYEGASLEWASVRNYTDIVDLLLGAGADPKAIFPSFQLKFKESLKNLDNKNKWKSIRDAFKLGESVNFERGKDPMTSMGIGSASGGESLFNMIWNEVPKLPGIFVIPKSVSKSQGFDWLWIELEASDGSRCVSYFKLVMDEKISLYSRRAISVILMESGNVYFYEDHNYRPLNNFSDFLKYFYTNENSSEENLDENLNFERGKDPKSSLRIGLKGNNVWNYSPSPNVFLDKWINLLKEPLGKIDNEYIKLASEFLKTPKDKIRIVIEPLDDWQEEFPTWKDYLNSPKYFDENMTYLGREWDFSDLNYNGDLYRKDEIKEEINCKHSATKVCLGNSGNVYVAGIRYDNPFMIMGTIY
jgi:hypothetical protein